MILSIEAASISDSDMSAARLARSSNLEIVVGLQSEPQFRRGTKVTREVESSLRRDSAPAVNNLVKAGRRDAQCDRECMYAEPAGLQVIFVQNFARMDRRQLEADFLRHDYSPCSVIVDNFDIGCSVPFPTEAHPVLVIDADAVDHQGTRAPRQKIFL